MKKHDKFESEIQSGIQIMPKNLGFSGKRLDFQAFQKSGLKPVIPTGTTKNPVLSYTL